MEELNTTATEIHNIVSKLNTNIGTYSSELEDIMHSVVEHYMVSLTEILVEIREAMNGTGDISITELEMYTLKLANALYFVGANIEEVGMKQAIAKVLKKEVYNDTYIKNDIGTVDESGKKVKPTIATNQALSEQASKYEEVLSALYDSAYKTLKNQLDAAYENLSSLKKILSSRMQERELANVGKANIQ